MAAGEEKKEAPVTTTKSEPERRVVVRTRGLTSTFKGLQFPEITRKGTEMTLKEYEAACECAKRQGIRIEEVK